MTNKFEIDFLEDYSQPSLLEELRRIQKIVGDRPITKVDTDKYSKTAWTTYFKNLAVGKNSDGIDLAVFSVADPALA